MLVRCVSQLPGVIKLAEGFTNVIPLTLEAWVVLDNHIQQLLLKQLILLKLFFNEQYSVLVGYATSGSRVTGTTSIYRL